MLTIKNKQVIHQFTINKTGIKTSFKSFLGKVLVQISGWQKILGEKKPVIRLNADQLSKNSLIN